MVKYMIWYVLLKFVLLMRQQLRYVGLCLVMVLASCNLFNSKKEEKVDENTFTAYKEQLSPEENMEKATIDTIPAKPIKPAIKINRNILNGEWVDTEHFDDFGLSWSLDIYYKGERGKWWLAADTLHICYEDQLVSVLIDSLDKDKMILTGLPASGPIKLLHAQDPKDKITLYKNHPINWSESKLMNILPLNVKVGIGKLTKIRYAMIPVVVMNAKLLISLPNIG